MTAEWYVRFGEKVRGPVSADQLRRALSQGKISTTTPVRRGQEEEWIPCIQVISSTRNDQKDKNAGVDEFTIRFEKPNRRLESIWKQLRDPLPIEHRASIYDSKDKKVAESHSIERIKPTNLSAWRLLGLIIVGSLLLLVSFVLTLFALLDGSWLLGGLALACLLVVVCTGLVRAARDRKSRSYKIVIRSGSSRSGEVIVQIHGMGHSFAVTDASGESLGIIYRRWRFLGQFDVSLPDDTPIAYWMFDAKRYGGQVLRFGVATGSVLFINLVTGSDSFLNPLFLFLVVCSFLGMVIGPLVAPTEFPAAVYLLKSSRIRVGSFFRKWLRSRGFVWAFTPESDVEIPFDRRMLLALAVLARHLSFGVRR